MNLLIDEPTRRIQFGDPRRHREPNAEVARSPRNHLAETDDTTRDAGHRPLTRVRHRRHMRINIE
ncbi:hypothetical protein, partial [Stenotrophomonas sp. SrG]|uniref:hypothetical protein n=1 Tax=Stenotrophomonas sp. SrG TaxID=3414430 RepID=UPI003CF1DAB8